MNLQERIRTSGLTQAQIARKTGLSISTISELARGVRKVTEPVFGKLLRLWPDLVTDEVFEPDKSSFKVGFEWEIKDTIEIRTAIRDAHLNLADLINPKMLGVRARLVDNLGGGTFRAEGGGHTGCYTDQELKILTIGQR